MLKEIRDEGTFVETLSRSRPPKKEQKRYNLVLPMELYEKLEDLAAEKDDTIAGVLKTFIKVGLVVAEYQDHPDKEVLLQEGDEVSPMPPLWWPY